MDMQGLVRKYRAVFTKILLLFNYQSAMNKPPQKIISFKHSSRKLSIVKEDLEKLSREELIDRVFKLEAHNHQLKNIISKSTVSPNDKIASTRVFDFDKVSKRHVFLKLYYLGWDFQGSVTQENTTETVEHYLFNALQKSCLIESKEKCNYHICGRTDKGVSAFSQVVSLDLRSQIEAPDENNVDSELPYCKMLNRILPKSIRCYAWSHVGSITSARFDCTNRTYKYYFPKGNLNIEAMQKAANYLVGTHDFRNFCKMDVKNAVTKFNREIFFIKIKPCVVDVALSSGFEMLELVIQGKSFLWHQIRCIMSLLLLIGQERESPDIIKELLNIDENPTKPQYAPASEFPLSLFFVDYQNILTKWNVDQTDLTKTIALLLSQWTDYSVKCVMVRDMLENLQKFTDNSVNIKSLMESLRYKKNKPLMSRMKCESLENRINHYIKKKRIEVVIQDPSKEKLSNGI